MRLLSFRPAALLFALVLTAGCGGPGTTPPADAVTDGAVFPPPPDAGGGLDLPVGDVPTGDAPAPDLTADAPPPDGAPADGGPDGPGPATSLRLMTFNIRHGAESSLEEVAAVINAETPDIVALQEMDVNGARSGNVDQPRRLGQLTGMASHFARAIDLSGGGSYGVALLSRFPLFAMRQRNLTSSGEQRIVTVVDVEPSPGLRLPVAVSHMDLDAATREVQAGQILDELGQDTGALAVLMGDLNFTPDQAPYDILTAELVDVWPLAGEGNGFTIPSGVPTRRIDYILLGQAHGTPIEAHVPDTTASDHRPVVATVPAPFALPARRQGALKVMTFNIAHAEGSTLEALARVINAEQPDLVGLQAVDVDAQRSGNVDQSLRLAQLTGMSTLFRSTLEFETGGRFGLALLSRYPQISSSAVELTFTGERRILALVDVELAGGMRIPVGITHLGTDAAERAQQAEDLVAALAGRERVVLLATLNATPDEAPYQTVAASYVDAFGAVGQGAGNTFPPDSPDRRIDYVFFGPEWAAPTEARVVAGDVSGHLPVVATVPLP